MPQKFKAELNRLLIEYNNLINEIDSLNESILNTSKTTQSVIQHTTANIKMPSVNFSPTDAKINAVNNNVDTVNTNVDTVNTNINTVNTNVDTVNTNVDTIKNNISIPYKAYNMFPISGSITLGSTKEVYRTPIFTIPPTAGIVIRFTIHNGDGYNACGTVYKNGTAFGTSHCESNYGANTDFSETLEFGLGDILSIYASGSGGSKIYGLKINSD